jgi:indole-3-glycerol phosphate synthase
VDILSKIIAHKKAEVARAKAVVGVEELRQRPLYERPRLSLQQSLLDAAKTGIIAEFKRRSPSKGVINDRAAVSDVTAAYTKWGASGLSVLTDGEFFGGSVDDLLAARANDIPILRKDFMVDVYQMEEARAMGADVVLLIAACLSPQQVQELAGYAKGLGLEVLLELHDEAELVHICSEVDMVGINNRNLKTFVVDIQRSIDLAAQIPDRYLKIAESGIENMATIQRFKAHGFQGFLIGEQFMKQAEPGKAFGEFVGGG